MIAVALAALLATGAASSDRELAVQTALRPLIAAGGLHVPASSGCGGPIVGVPYPTLGDYLAASLAGLDQGTNRIAGGCNGGACRLRITHAGGDDDVSSSEFRFRLAGGRLVPASLLCVSTP